jgi:hypothetical protein
MSEMEYQKDSFISKYKGQVPVNMLKIMFKESWETFTQLGDIMTAANMMAVTWGTAKKWYKI